MRFSKSLFIILGFVLITIASVRAPGSSTTSTTSGADHYYPGCYINVSLVSQDPYPATPDSYVDVVFQVTGIQNSACGGAKFELVPSYPFSLLNANDALRTLNATTYAYGYSGVWDVPYKLRVDKDALDADSDLEVHYAPGNVLGNAGLDSPTIEKFKIKVQDARTSFDAVMQESTGSQVSIAIANTGKYAANSVVVRIPKQTDYSVVGTDGQMVGNLASGDYSMVSFTVSPNRAGTIPQNMTSRRIASQNMTYYPRNMTRSQNTASKKLEFDIYYTDNIGERRVVNMSLPFNYGNGNATNNFSGSRTAGSRTTSTGTSSLLPSSNPWVIVVLILIMAFIAYRVYRIKRDGKKGTASHEIPDWVKNSEKKGKNK